MASMVGKPWERGGKARPERQGTRHIALRVIVEACFEDFSSVVAVLGGITGGAGSLCPGQCPTWGSCRLMWDSSKRNGNMGKQKMVCGCQPRQGLFLSG